MIEPMRISPDKNEEEEENTRYVIREGKIRDKFGDGTIGSSGR